MGRREQHPQDSILDGARTVVAAQGLRAVTIGAIAEASGAPTGSIYHRFGSLDEVLAQLWIRAVRRSQEACVLALTEADPLQAVVTAALGTYDFCFAQREDARLLALFRREDFLSAQLPAEVHAELRGLNDTALEATSGLARRIFGRANRAAVDLVLAAAVDLPYGLARPYLEAGTIPPQLRRQCLPAAVRALLRDGAP